MEDSLAWHYDSKEALSVKSAYHVGVSLKGEEETVGRGIIACSEPNNAEVEENLVRSISRAK